MPKELYYPNKKAVPADIFTAEMLSRTLGTLLSWQQGVGSFGNLTLHGCWLESGVLRRRYQGQFASQSADYLEAMMCLYDRTDNPDWKLHARGIAESLLFLQDNMGGFRHASGENEPSYYSSQTCPIHQGLPLIGLINYYAWEHSDDALKEKLKNGIRKHITWFADTFWKRGNGHVSPLPYDGWCGVTNQDLVVVYALARYGTVFGDWEPYEKYGKPALDTFLGEHYYFPVIGKFERGDAHNFVERTPYYFIIIDMLRGLNGIISDKRLLPVITNISEAVFDAAFEAEDGNTYLAWGMETDPVDKTKKGKWIQKPRYATTGLLYVLGQYLEEHPDQSRQAIFDRLEKTFCSFVYADGTIPQSLGTDDPLFTAVSSNRELLWYLLERIEPGQMKNITPIPPQHIERRCRSITYCSTPLAWRITRDGKPIYTGIKVDTGAIAIGDELFERAPNLNFEDPELIEIVQ